MNRFGNKDGQIYVQKINDFLDKVFVGLEEIVLALVNHRKKLLADAIEENNPREIKDVKDFTMERIAKAVNITSGAEIMLRDLKRVILPLLKY